MALIGHGLQPLDDTAKAIDIRHSDGLLLLAKQCALYLARHCVKGIDLCVSQPD